MEPVPGCSWMPTQEAISRQEIRRAKDRERKRRKKELESEEQTKRRRLSNTLSQSQKRNRESDSERQQRLRDDAERHHSLRDNETDSERQQRLRDQAERQDRLRDNETDSERQQRLRDQAERQDRLRDQETDSERQQRLDTDATQHREQYSELTQEMASVYISQVQERSQRRRQQSRFIARTREMPDRHHLGPMSAECRHCSATFWLCERSSGSRTNPNFNQCCKGGDIVLPALGEMPDLLKQLFDNGDRISREFRQNIIAYNSLLSFSSCGAKIDESLIQRSGVYSYRIQGQMFHLMGSLLPTSSDPKFLQLYFYDTDNETDNRLRQMPNTDRELIGRLQQMLREVNPWIAIFKSFIERTNHNSIVSISLRITGEGKDPRTYNRPTASDIAAIIPGDNQGFQRDVIVDCRAEGLKRISKNHRSYDPFSYVLLFPNGEYGWSCDMRRTSGAKVTQLNYYCFRLHFRKGSANIHRYGRLMLKFVVDAFARIEQYKLTFIRTHQKEIRAEVYQGLVDAINDNTTSLANIGRSVILPSSFYNSPRYMIQQYQDAMAMVRELGKPDLFVTFTCNPNWPEITENLLPHQTANDRPDPIARVFHQKMKCLKEDLIENSVLGRVLGFCFTIEFQKRGLPHCHMLLILEPEDKVRNTDDIDEIVSAVIPDRERFPLAYETVKKCMVHGPCGALNPNSPCMKDGKCSKGYPKDFVRHTHTPDDGYPKYKRPDDGARIVVERDHNRFEVDNRFVVPHNLYLCSKYNAHINVEISITVKCVKYIYKYINKGPDKANVEICHDEVKSYLDARYLSSCESCWRIFEYNLHENRPNIYRLEVHLPDQHTVTFGGDDSTEQVLEREKKTKLMAWLDYNSTHDDGLNLLYIDFPKYYTFSKNRWDKRKRNLAFTTIGRMYLVNPRQGDKYYLRLMLTQVKGAKSFEDLRTVNSVVFDTYKEAAQALGLLESDDEWIKVMDEAVSYQTPMQFRVLFTSILVYCSPANPRDLFNRFIDELTRDALRQLGVTDEYSSLENGQLKELALNFTLTQIDNMLITNNMSLAAFQTLPQITRRETGLSRLIAEEVVDDTIALDDLASDMARQLNSSQRLIFDEIIDCVTNARPKIFFVDGPGGSGKTYLYNTLLAFVRSQRRLAIAMASSGFAALLLDRGRTAHSRFKIPIEINETSTCFIAAQSDLAELIRRTDLFIWDEAPMMSKYVFEAVDRTFKDLMGNQWPFGGKVFVFGGDFRQILPVVKNGAEYGIINSCFKRSHLWRHVNSRKLTINMRLRGEQDDRQKEFAQYLLDIGDGKVPSVDQMIKLPAHFCRDITIFSVFAQEILPQLSDWTILCAKNDDVDRLNQMFGNMVDGDEHLYLSADTISNSDNPAHINLYPPEYLNTLNISGIPPHRLILKIGTPIMLLRNINPTLGLCNGTQLKCISFKEHLIEAEITSDCHKGDRVFLHRMTLHPSDNLLPFTFGRRQFPIRPCYAMSINNAQGQTLNKVALYLQNHVFTHGQLYVAMSRVQSYKNLVIFTYRDSDDDFTARNIVYKL